MGKGPRGGQERTIRAYEPPIWDANTLLARNAGNLYYGGATDSPAGWAASQDGQPSGGGAGPRQQGTPQEPQVSGGGGITQEQFNQMFPGESLSSDQLWARREELEAMGVEVMTNASGKHHKIRMPDGSVMDVIGGAERGDNNRQWLQARGPGGVNRYTGDGAGVPGQTLRDYNEVFGRYGEFADTGGYSSDDLANIRARAVSPIRSIYSGARRDIDRQRSLQGGYSPNRTAALAKMAREQSYTTADANTNVEAAIAQMVQQGKLAGMGGQAGLYGTSPGLAGTFGSQALAAQGLQNQSAQAMIQNRAQSQMMPGAVDTSIGRIGQVAQAGLPFVMGGGGQFSNPFTGGTTTTTPYAPTSNRPYG